jgi:hypothetical protein
VRPGHRDHVEPDAAGRGEAGGQVRGREPAQPGLLGGGDGGRRAAVAVAAPGLHLAEDQQAGAGGDEVDLALAAAPVSGDDPQTSGLQPAAGERLAEAAELAPSVAGGSGGGHAGTLAFRRGARAAAGEIVDNRHAILRG